MKLFSMTCLMTGLVLAGCSSGGGGSHSLSAPVTGTLQTPANRVELTPLPAEQSPALRSGSYDANALWLNGSGDETTYASGLVQIKVNAETDTYTVIMDLPGLPVESSFLTAGEEFGHHVVRTSRYSNGTEQVEEYDLRGTIQSSTAGFVVIDEPSYETYVLDYRLGLSHVALARWGRHEWIREGTGYHYDGTPDLVYFVHGDRTAAGDIPLTGTATYNVEPGNSGSFIDPGNILFASYGIDGDGRSFIDFTTLPFTLTADFARQTMAALIDGPATTYQDDYDTHYTWGLQASGSGPMGESGNFQFQLSGTLTSIDPDITDQTRPVNGALEGALYGPDAEQVGGTFYLGTPDNSAGISGAFVGER